MPTSPEQSCIGSTGCGSYSPIKEEEENGNPFGVQTLAIYHNDKRNGDVSLTITGTDDYHSTPVCQAYQRPDSELAGLQQANEVTSVLTGWRAKEEIIPNGCLLLPHGRTRPHRHHTPYVWRLCRPSYYYHMFLSGFLEGVLSVL